MNKKDKRLTQIDRKLDSLTKLFLENDMSVEVFRRRRERLVAERRRIVVENTRKG